MITQMTTTIIIRPIIDGSIKRSFLERLSKNTAIDNYIDDCGCTYQKKTVREKYPSFSHGLHLTIFFTGLIAIKICAILCSDEMGNRNKYSPVVSMCAK